MPGESLEDQEPLAGADAPSPADGPVTAAWTWNFGLRSLSARISLFVLMAAAVSSLTVTGLSVVSMDSFLRAKIDQKFPSILASVSERLDLWYDQRALEIGVFSSSAIVVDNVELIRDRARSDTARSEIETYLTYLIDSSPQYQALFVFDAAGNHIASAGGSDEVRLEQREAIRSNASQLRNEPIHVLGSRLQIASRPIRGKDGSVLGSIHSLLRTDSIESQLYSEDLGDTGEIYVIDASGTVTLGSAEGGASEEMLADAREHGSSPVRDFSKPSGERMIGAARAFDRFDWTIVVDEAYAEAFAPSVTAVQRVVRINVAIALVLCAGAFGVARTISRPIRGLADAAERISNGERDVPIPARDNGDEVGMLARTLDSMLTRLAENREEIERSHQESKEANRQLVIEKAELQRANEVLEQLSITDGLTKLHNHRYFQDQLVRETRRVDRTEEPLSLVLIDIDHFKSWNDRLGHATGDEILRKLASSLNEATRETDLLARYGGEEFALLVANTDLEGARALAEKIRQRVAATQFVISPPSENENVTISAGVAQYKGDRTAFFVAADEALYSAKNNGRDCVFAEGD